jgi:hypothetical protein
LISARKWFENITYGANVSGIGEGHIALERSFRREAFRGGKATRPQRRLDADPIPRPGHEKERISATPPQKLCAGPLSNSETLKLASS